MQTSELSPPATRKSWRLNLRGRQELGDLLERAALLSGLDPQEYVRQALAKACVDTIRDHQVIKIAAEDGEAFMAMWNNLEAPAPEVWARAGQREQALFDD